MTEPVQVINDPFTCTRVEKVGFQAKRFLEKLHGLCNCFSLHQIEIHAFVENMAGFSNFITLEEVIFAAMNCFWLVDLFNNCVSLDDFEICVLTGSVVKDVFQNCPSIASIVVTRGSLIRQLKFDRS
jgi:hypothetical protein